MTLFSTVYGRDKLISSRSHGDYHTVDEQTCETKDRQQSLAHRNV